MGDGSSTHSVLASVPESSLPAPPLSPILTQHSCLLDRGCCADRGTPQKFDVNQDPEGWFVAGWQRIGVQGGLPLSHKDHPCALRDATPSVGTATSRKLWRSASPAV